MLTKEVSQKYMNNALNFIHAKRVLSLFETSWALTKEANLTISSLGNNKEGNAYVKHKIKSVDRLVGNATLHKELFLIYKHFFQCLMTYSSILYVLVDWSGCCGDEFYMLRASLVHNGRSLSIYNEIHPQKKLGNREVQNQFLMALKKMIPTDKKVVIITDAGFSTPWFKSVLKCKWDYIGRLTSCTMIQPEDQDRWIKVKDFHHIKNNRVRWVGKSIIGKRSKTPVEGNIYCYKNKNKKRKDKSRLPNQNERYGAMYKRPWIIATSLKNSEYGGDFIINMYKNRMQIEQNFRDEKNARFGFGWRLGRTKCMKRLAVLCLIAHIASFFLLQLGAIAESLNLHKHFQVNTKKDGRVLSLLTLAKLIMKQETIPILYQKHKKILSLMIKENLCLC